MRSLPRALAVVLLAAGLSVPIAAAAAPSPTPSPGPVAPDLRTTSWVLADLDSGAILAMQNPDLPLPPASTLKVLTALTVAPHLSPDQPYRADAADEVAEGTRVVMHDGLEYKVSDLMHAALLPSANDAAQALARANGGVDVTVAQMSEEAARLGATSTVVRNASGLDAQGQVTTARDLAVLGRAAMANPEISAYLALRNVEFPGKQAASGRVIYPIYNHNRLVRDRFEGVLGGKSGYTTEAGRTYVGAAARDGRRLVVSLLRIGGNTYTTAAQLLDWGFANAGTLQPVGQLAEPSAPAPTFDRAIHPLPPAPSPTSVGQDVAAQAPVEQADPTANDAPVAAPAEPVPAEPAPAADTGSRLIPRLLTLLTLMGALAVGLRARVYWAARRQWSRPVTVIDLRTPRSTPRTAPRRPYSGDRHDLRQHR